MKGERSGRRVAISLVCWVLSSIGVLMSLMMIVGSSIAAVISDPAMAFKSAGFYFGIAAAFAWTALAVMNVDWLKGKTTPWFWPIAGGLAGGACTAVFLPFVLLFLPCIVLSIYLCCVHLTGTAGYEKRDA